MSDADRSLLALVRANAPSNADVAACWELLVEGIQRDWVESGEFDELRGYLRQGNDWGIEELLFANLGDSLRVTLVDDHRSCVTDDFLRAMDTVKLANTSSTSYGWPFFSPACVLFPGTR